MKKLSYSSSGVSINKGNKFVSEIKNIIRKDKNLKKSNIGGFSGQYILDPKIKNNSTILAINFSNLLIINIKEISIKDAK